MIEYSKCIVTFIDILGFAKVVESESSPTRINSILERFKEAAIFPKELELNVYDYRLVNFSDTIVRVTDISGERKIDCKIGIFSHELSDIFFAQGMLLRDNILLRGSMTIGDIYLNEDRIFGPALNRAYKLEKEIALYPRIIVDPLLLETYDKDNLIKGMDCIKDKINIKKFIRMDFDGVWHINYLSYLDNYKYSALAKPNKYYFDLLGDHRKVILDRSKQIDKISNISLKCNWLTTYHNQIISGFGEKFFMENDVSSADFYVRTEEVPTLYKF